MDSFIEEIKRLQEKIEHRKAKMVQLVNEKIKEDSEKNDDFVSFYSEVEVEAGDELEGVCDEWWQTACEVESPLNSKLEKTIGFKLVYTKD